MDLIEKKLINIIHFNNDKLKEEENLTENEETKLKNILDKISGIFLKNHLKFNYFR